MLLLPIPSVSAAQSAPKSGHFTRHSAYPVIPAQAGIYAFAADSVRISRPIRPRSRRCSAPAAMTYRRITLTTAGDCAAIRLLPPPAGDGCGGITIDAAMAAELRECCRQLALSDEIRAVSIYGIGNGSYDHNRPIFAVGRHQPPPPQLQSPERWATELRAAEALASLPMPVVAALNGDALAHGLELSLAADLRIAIAGAQLGAGHPLADGFPYDGATQRLPRLAGPAVARDLLFTGRTLSAAEALAAGIVNRVVPAAQLDDTVAELMSTIAAAAPIAARYAKEAVTAAGNLPLTQGLRLEADLNIILQTTADRAEGLRSFTEKRPPLFQGR